tara:strand:+ start:1 stop:1440 length:1440 start_codon:yes stop_codon:yes gene_type:complete
MSVAAPSSAAYKLWSHPAHNDISYVFEKKGTETFDLNSLSNANSSKFFFTVYGIRGENGKATGKDFSANYFPHTYTPQKIEYLKKETSLIADSSFVISSTVKDISFSMTSQTGAATASTKFVVQSVANGQRHLHTQADACLNINSFVFYNLFDISGKFYQKLNFIGGIDWESPLHYRFYVDESVSDGAVKNTDLVDISNQSFNKASYTNRLYLDSTSTIKTKTKNGKSLKYIHTSATRSTFTGCVRFRWTSLKKKYHMFMLYDTDGYGSKSAVPFFYHQGYQDNSNWKTASDGTQNFNAILKSCLSIGRYPEQSPDTSLIDRRDHTGLFSAITSREGDKGWSMHPFKSDGSSLMYSAGCNYGGSNGQVATHRRTCCLVVKFDTKKAATAGNSTGHYGTYTYSGTTSNPTIIFDRNKWGYNVQHTINCMKFGGFEGHTTGHGAPTLNLYEVCIIEDNVEDDVEKAIATGLLKKWLPVLSK